MLARAVPRAVACALVCDHAFVTKSFEKERKKESDCGDDNSTGARKKEKEEAKERE
jgi:hypothetical protein